MSENETPSGFKYAALILPRQAGPRERLEIVPGKETLVGRISSLVPPDGLTFWRGWLGSVAWDRLDDESRIVLVRDRSAAPDADDGEDQRLSARVSTSWRALLLCDADPRIDAQAWILTGRAESLEGGSQLMTARRVAQLLSIAPLWYAGRQEFLRTTMVPRMQREWETTGKWGEEWFGRWVEIDRLLSTVPGSPILQYALLAHENARTSPQPEFAIPGLVRTAEGVLALQKGKGAKSFAKRALRLLPALPADPYVGGEAEGLLLDLYEARNECYHGKVPFLKLQALGEEGIERVSRMSYVADVLAREALLQAFRFRDRAIFQTRESLEEAWRSGAFPARRDQSA